MTHEPNEAITWTAEIFLALIERHLPDLWQAHA
jgi:hypothetical protein